MSINVRQTNVMEFLTDKFNENSFGIPFKQGFYVRKSQEDLDIIWYKPKLNERGLFDIESSYNDETYVANENRFLVMQTDVSSGDYIGLPDIDMVSFTANVEVLIYADDPLILVTSKMALDEIRDSFIGTRHLYQVLEQNENTIDDVRYRIVSNAGGIDYGSELILKGRRFIVVSFRIELMVSKNVDFGNQIKWEIAKYDNDLGQYGSYYEVKPLISSWGVNQEMTSEQTLNSINPVEINKAREVHNYVKSRGFGATFTFLKSNNFIVREMFKETTNTPTSPQRYKIRMSMEEFNDVSNVFEFRSDLGFEKNFVYGEAQVADVVYGEPIMFAIGFVVSAK